MPPEEKAAFLAYLDKSQIYLEYGSGGSTLAALKRAAVVISVENDRAFFQALKRGAKHCAPQRKSSLFHQLFVDTGKTEIWGLPVQEKTAHRWNRYPQTPWWLIERSQLFPDLILIDGRFRVACALESLLRLPQGSRCLLFLDDFGQYEGAYQPVLDFADDVQIHGRAISFRRPLNLDTDQCRRALDQYYRDYR